MEIYATGYEKDIHPNSKDYLNGGGDKRNHLIKGNENKNDIGHFLFYIGKQGISAATTLKEAYMSFDQKTDSKVILNGSVNGINEFYLKRVDGYSTSDGTIFTITSSTDLATKANSNPFSTGGTISGYVDIGENKWYTVSKAPFTLKSGERVNVNYLRVDRILIEKQDWDTSNMECYMRKMKLHVEFNERYYAKFYSDGTHIQTQTVNKDSAAANFTPTKTGYVFQGWRCSTNNQLYKPGEALYKGTLYDITYTAEWQIGQYTINFKNTDGSTISSKTLTYNTNIGDLPSISRNGYTFAGWVPCAPAKKTDGNILDSLCYYGDKDSPKPLSQSYKYTNNLSLHIEAFMDNWDSMANPTQQIISCTEGGGWGLGYIANTVGHGVEIHTGSYKGVDLGFGTSGKFTNGQWYCFDVVFTNSTLKAYVNGVEKGSVTTGASISYNSANTIFVGGEAGGSATDAAGNYFNGLISNVFIADSPNRLAYATTTTKMPGENVNYYPVWRVNRYTISFNANGGNVSSTSKVVAFNHSYRNLPTPTRTGYTFDGWFTKASGGTKITSSTIFTSLENQILYAQWTPIPYTIHFDGNGYDFGAVSSISTKYDAEKISLNKNNYKKIGYKFIGWNTNVDGTGISYSDKELVQNLTTNSSIVLYAQWEFVGDINYNNLFSLSNWGTSYSGMINENDAKMIINFQQGNINIKDLTGKEVPDIYTSYAISEGHYHIPVKSNTKYIFKFNVSQNYSENDLGQFFLFYYTNNAACSNPHQGWRPIKISGEYTGEFTTPVDCVKIGMRFGIYSPYADITFSNIFICEKSRYDNLISKISNYKIRDYLPNFNSLPELPSVDTGYLFDGWRGEDNRLASSLTNNQIKETQNSIIAYSFQRPITYTLQFNKNYENEKGSGIMANQTFVYDEAKKLTKNVFTRYRYKFIKWKANIKNEERFFNDEEEILNLFSNQNDSITLYAQWEYIPIENTIKLDNNIFASKVLFDNIPVIEILIDKTVFFREHL